MSLLQRFLGIGDKPESQSSQPSAGTESVRRIAAELESLPPSRARHLAAFAYVLARVAQADLEVDAAEKAEMERAVRTLAALEEAEARVVVEIAWTQARDLGGTENYLVTREFKNHSTLEERVRLVECVFAVAAADGGISSRESGEALAIAEELGFTRAQALGMRSAWREHLDELRELPKG
ncbi:MAG: TerB family tellurite resistance protein [Proteobacteria bacterium]|nr:TerB family tellurite resistance protein [Pseudomonadota bacterium]MCZ6784017.1 TerB family tellurite resistance protein [Pseudomonadota bacterium]